MFLEMSFFNFLLIINANFLAMTNIYAIHYTLAQQLLETFIKMFISKNLVSRHKYLKLLKHP